MRMKHCLLALLIAFFSGMQTFGNPIKDLLERIDPGASKKFAIELKEGERDFFELDQKGKREAVSGNSYVNAKITDMKIEDYVQQVTTADGRIVDALDGTKKDVVFTIETTVPKDTPTPTIGTQEIRAGRTMIVKTNDFETTGNIDSVDIADE